MTDLWTAATLDVDEDREQAVLAAARVASADAWPFLAEAEHEGAFLNRTAVVADHLDRVCSALADGAPFAILRARLEASLLEDFRTLAAARPAPIHVQAMGRFSHALPGQRKARDWSVDRTNKGTLMVQGGDCIGHFDPETGEGHFSTAGGYFHHLPLGKPRTFPQDFVDKAKAAAPKRGSTTIIGQSSFFHHDSTPVAEASLPHSATMSRAELEAHMAEHHGRPGEGLPRFIMEDEHSYVHGPNSGATTHHVHGSLQSQAATDFNSGVERLHPTEIKEGDMVLKQPHHTPFKAQEVKHYKGWSSCWADDKGPGHRVEFSHDEPAFRLKGKQASLQTTAASWGRRHYEDLASVLSKHGDAAAAKHFANHLASTNTAYKPEQFLRAAESPSYQKRSSGTPVYTQSHYQHIAAGVASFPGNKHALANTLATHLSNSAGKFDQKRFMKAAIGDTTKAPKPPKPAIASLPEPGSARRTAAPLDPDMSAAPGQTGPDAGETDDEGMMDDANVTGFTPGQTVTVEYQMPDGTTGTCDAVVQTVNPDGSIAFTYDNGAFTVSDAGDGTYADAQGATFEIQPADADAAQDVTGGDPEDAPGGGKPPSKNKNPFGAQASLAHDEEASRDWHQRRRTAGNPFDGTDPANPFNVAAPDPAAAPGADMPGAPPPPPPAAAPAPGAGAPPAPLAAPATSPDGQGDPDMDDDGTSPKSQAMSLLVAHVRSTNPSISVQAARSLAAEALSRYPVLETVNA